MKNKEKYAKEIVEIVCDGCFIAVDKSTGKPEKCVFASCNKCLFSTHESSCVADKKTREWAESEYIERPVISKRDREFLEYLGDEMKYIARDKKMCLMAYEDSVTKGEDGWDFGFGVIKSLSRLNVQFPMVKWSDSEPWLIEDLKKLEVVEEYEYLEQKHG